MVLTTTTIPFASSALTGAISVSCPELLRVGPYICDRTSSPGLPDRLRPPESAKIGRPGISRLPEMTLPQPSQSMESQAAPEASPATRRTALPSRPTSSREASHVAQPSPQGYLATRDQEQARVAALSPNPPSPNQQQEPGSPPSHNELQTTSSQGYIGQVCR